MALLKLSNNGVVALLKLANGVVALLKLSNNRVVALLKLANGVVALLNLANGEVAALLSSANRGPQLENGQESTGAGSVLSNLLKYQLCIIFISTFFGCKYQFCLTF